MHTRACTQSTSLCEWNSLGSLKASSRSCSQGRGRSQPCFRQPSRALTYCNPVSKPCAPLLQIIIALERQTCRKPPFPRHAASPFQTCGISVPPIDDPHRRSPSSSPSPPHSCPCHRCPRVPHHRRRRRPRRRRQELDRHQQQKPHSLGSMSETYRSDAVLGKFCRVPLQHPSEPSRLRPRSQCSAQQLSLWLGFRRGSALQLAQLLARLSRAAGSALGTAQHGSWLGSRRGSAWQLARLSARLSMAAGSAISTAQHGSWLGFRRGSAWQLARLSLGSALQGLAWLGAI